MAFFVNICQFQKERGTDKFSDNTQLKCKCVSVCDEVKSTEGHAVVLASFFSYFGETGRVMRVSEGTLVN